MDGGVMDVRWRDVDDDGDEFWFRIAVSDGGGTVEVYLGKMPYPQYFQVRGYM
jgi:hypothetical protein